jgi:hypothetical protein
MTKQFITFSEGEDYNNLCSVLNDSISQFSNYNLTIYNSNDFDIPWEPEKWQPGYAFIFKILSCLKSLESFDEVVWLDTDVVVTSIIDEIWNYENKNYPLLPKYRFSNFINWPHTKIDFNDISFLSGAKNLIGIDSSTKHDYLQACCMKFDSSSREFLEEVLSYFNDFQSNLFPLGDESIINVLLCKYKLKENLGDIFLCTQHFDYYHIEKFFNLDSNNIQDYQDLFNIKLTPEDEKIRIMYKRTTNEILTITYGEHNRLGLINCSNKILFLHGNKSYQIHRHYLDAQNKILIEKKNKNVLCDLMRLHGSDKSTSHNYTKIYHHLFSEFIGKEINIFELGLGTNNSNMNANMEGFGNPGGSLRAWNKYFENSKVFGADIDTEILFEEENIKTFYCDQTNSESVANLWKNSSIVDIKFDIIIDDGYHNWSANYNFLINSIHKIKKGGYYIIEDLLPASVEQIKQQFFELKQQYPEFDFNLMKLKGREPRIDNNILVIKKIYDFEAIKNII